MSRTISAAMQAALQGQDLRPVILFESEFPSGVLRLWSGLGDIVWSGRTWVGAGTLMGVAPVEETTDVVAAGTAVTLSGVPSDLVSLVLAEAQQGAPGRLWLGLMAANGALIADPVAWFVGRLDVPSIDDGAETCTVQVTYESRLIDLNRAREWRYTDESQRALYPDDRGLEYVTAIQDRPIAWGRG